MGNKLIGVRGGLGKSITILPSIQELKKQGHKIAIASGHDLLWNRVSFIDKYYNVTQKGEIDNYFDFIDESTDCEVLNPEPYNLGEFLHPSNKHISELYKMSLGLDSNIKGNDIPAYKFEITQNEENDLDHLMSDSQKILSKLKKVVILQFVGGGMFRPDIDIRAIPQHLMIEIYKMVRQQGYYPVFVNNHEYGQIFGLHDAHNGVIVPNILSFLRIVKQYNPKMILIDSSLQHFLNTTYIRDEFNPKAFVVWSKTNPVTFGYNFNQNYIFKSSCPVQPCNRAFGTLAAIKWNCNYNEVCRKFDGEFLENINKYLLD